jgi:23S rRNA pseudouridine1911/1915/1917 synthase
VESPAPTLAAIVREQTGLSWSRARALCAEGRVSVDGERCTDPAMRVAAGASVVVSREAPRAPKGPLAREAIVYQDRDIVVVDKPAGVLTVPDTRGNKETLVEYTRTLLRRAAGRSSDTGLDVVHRLDRDTSGLVVLTRTAEAKRALAALFRAHDVERAYHAIAHGSVSAADIETFLLPDRGDGLRGSHGVYRRAAGAPPADAKRAVTHVRPLETLRGATLVECRLETGRQHQIRIHLAEQGHPLVGEGVYIRDYTGPRIPAPRTLLHARTLGFAHPRDGRPLAFESEPPADFTAALAALRR